MENGSRFPCGRVDRMISNRRQFLSRAGNGFGMLALAELLGGDRLLASDATSDGAMAPKPTHFAAKARCVIWLFMEGGPSAMDTFDPKTELDRHHGQRPGRSIDVFFGSPGPLMRSPFGFQQYGQSGAWVCDRLPHLARHVDDLALIKGCFAESPAHGPAMYQMNTGVIRAGFPSAGSWVAYGLGTENQSLPGFVVLQNSRGSKGGAGNWGAGFLPSAYQATTFRAQGSPILDLNRLPDVSETRQHAMLELSARLNGEHAERHPGEADLLARIQNYELAGRMQTEAMDAVSFSAESRSVRSLYGLDEDVTRPFGEKCLLARRLVERGVRFVQVYCNDEWDAHNDLKGNHGQRCLETDRPIAGLLCRPQTTRATGIDARRLGRRVRPDAGLRERRRPRSQPEWISGLDGRRGSQGGCKPRGNGRHRLEGRLGTYLSPRPARHDPALAWYGSQTAHVSAQRPPIPTD